MSYTDIPRVYTGLAEWLSCLMIVVHLAKEDRKVVIAIFSALFLGIQICVQILAGMLPWMLWIPGMCVAVLVMASFIGLTCRIPANDLIWYTCRAFILAEFMASFEWQIHSYYMEGKPWGLGPVVFCLLVYCLIVVSIFFLSKRYLKELKKAITRKEALNSIIITILIFAFSNFSYLPIRSPFRGILFLEIFYIRTLVDLCGVVILILMEQQHAAQDAELEIRTMELVLQQQYDQYRQTKNSVDLINRKYHDLKHQIQIIRAEQGTEKQEDYLSKLEQEIAVFEANIKTGNDVLDTILSGKSLYCTQHEIQMNVVADGALLNQMDTMDLCSVFGNALDNAIEYVDMIPEKEKRLIRVAVCSQNNFILIRFENYCESRLEYENSVPKTTKGNNGYHGFGIKSIRATAEKYGGSMVVKHEDNWFRLIILLPAVMS